MPDLRSRPATSQGRWLIGILVISTVYLAPLLTRGWFPHDEGALGQTAERVLQGEVPHRDFDEPYTGLLTYLHATAFAIAGIRLPVLRIPLFLGTLLWLASVFGIARRLTSPRTAAGVALVALVWSVPNYPASIPSWYNLFCATFGAGALIRWVETRGVRWLFLAGLAGGISVLFKLSGVFYVAGAMLFLVFAAHSEGHPRTRDRAGARIASSLVILGLAVSVSVLWRAIAPLDSASTVLHFVLPGALLAVALGIREVLLSEERGTRPPLGALMASAGPFLAGAAAPVALFGFGYALVDGLPALIQGVLVTPFGRLQFASLTPPAPRWLLAAAPLIILLSPRADASDPRWKLLGTLAAGCLAVGLWLAYTVGFAHQFVWQSIRSLIPVIALLTATLLVRPKLARNWVPGSYERFVLLVSITTIAGLIQFPFASPVYFLYVAPLVLLCVVALVEGIGRTPSRLAAVTLGFYAAFAVLLVSPGGVVGQALHYETNSKTQLLDLPRGGLRVHALDAALYGYLIPQVQRRAAGGAIWAGPDAPEVYFLSGLRNETRMIFHFLSPPGSDAAVLGALMKGTALRAVVIHHRPPFSPRLPEALLETLRSEFPEWEGIGPFELRWRR